MVITDAATFNLVLQLPALHLSEADRALRRHRERIDQAWPGLGAHLAVDAAGRHHFTLNGMPQGRAIANLEPLRGLPLDSLHLGGAKIADLTPLRGMTRLTTLIVNPATYAHLLSGVVEALRREAYDEADQALDRALADYADVPALAALRQLLAGGIANLRAFKTQPSSRPPFLLRHNGRSYAWIPLPMTWDEARRMAETARGHLPSVPGDDDNAWLLATFGRPNLGQMIWLGGTDELVEGSWGWLDGGAWTFEHWNEGEPNNAGGGEHALALQSDGWWLDADGRQMKLPFAIAWKE